MPERYIGTNWKMNMDPVSVSNWTGHLREYMLNTEDKPTVFVMPPFPLIPQLVEELKGTGVLIGAQNCHWETSGSFTGEVSAGLLSQIGVDLVLVGHAERRKQFLETNQIIHDKLCAIVNKGMRAVLCIGEGKSVRGNAPGTERVLREQLETALKGLRLGCPGQIIIAYEPVWAIGKNGEEPISEEIQAALEIIRNVSTEIIGEQPPIIYGGSVTPENARKLLLVPFVEGLFVGRHALDCVQFTKVIQTEISEGAEINE